MGSTPIPGIYPIRFSSSASTDFPPAAGPPPAEKSVDRKDVWVRLPSQASTRFAFHRRHLRTSRQRRVRLRRKNPLTARSYGFDSHPRHLPDSLFIVGIYGLPASGGSASGGKIR